MSKRAATQTSLAAPASITPASALGQRAAINSSQAPEVPSIVNDVLHSAGRPLEAGIRADMEPHFGYDFSRVRVHTDTQAAESARAVNARAFTVGNKVVFGRGQYQPGSRTGKQLLTHELAHVIQQANTPPARSLTISEAHDPHELEAARAANQIGAGQPVVALTAQPTQQISRVSDDDLGAKAEWQAKSPEERQKILTAGPDLSYSTIKDSIYQQLIDAATATRETEIGVLQGLASHLPAALQPTAFDLIDHANSIIQIAFDFLFGMVGVNVGFGEGLVELVKGIVQIIYALIQFLGDLLAAVFGKTDLLEEDLRALQHFVENFGPALQQLFDDWKVKFTNAPQERKAAMIGELVGQVIAFIITWEVSSAKIGKLSSIEGSIPMPVMAEAFATGARASTQAIPFTIDVSELGGPAGFASTISAQAVAAGSGGTQAQSPNQGLTSQATGTSQAATANAEKEWGNLLAQAERPTPRQTTGGFRSSPPARIGNKEVRIIEGTVEEQIPQSESMAKYSSTLKGEHGTHAVGMQLGENLPEGITSAVGRFNVSEMKIVENTLRETANVAAKYGAVVETRTILKIEYVAKGSQEVPVLVGVERTAWVRVPGPEDVMEEFIDFRARLDVNTRAVVVDKNWIMRPVKQ